MSQENVEIVRRWWQGFNDQGIPPLDLCDEKVEIEIPAEFPFSGPYHGHGGVRKWADEVFDVISDHRVEIEEIIDAGDGETVVMALRSLGHARYMELDLEVPWAAVWTIREGKLVYAQGYMRKAEALEAAGLRE